MKRTQQFHLPHFPWQAFSFALMAGVLWCSQAQAANLIWDFGGGTGNWATAANWAVAPGGANQTPVNGDALYWTSTSNAGFGQTNNLAADTQIAGLRFGVIPPSGTGSTSVGGFVIGGNRIALTGDIENFTTNATGVQRINTDFLISTGSVAIRAQASPTLFSAGATEDFIFGGTFTSTGAAGIVIRGDGNGKVLFNGQLNHNGSFFMTDANTTVTFNNTNNYTGLTTVARGTLITNVNNALPSTTVVRMGQSFLNANASTLDLNGTSQVIAGLEHDTSPNNNQTHTVTSTAPATLTINNTGNFVFGSGSINGTITGAISLVKEGTGTQTLGGVNTYTGATTVSQGRLVLTNTNNDYSSSSGYNIASGAVLEINQTTTSRFASTTAQFTGAGTFLKTGPALTFLANGATTQTFNMSAGGQIDIQGGTLSHFSTQAGNLASLNINGGAAGNISNLNPITTVFFDALTGGGTLNMTAAGTRTVTLGVNNTAAGTYNGAGTATFSGVIGNTGTINLVKTGTGTQILSGVNTYTGSTTVSQGRLVLTNTNNDYSASSGYNIASGAVLEINQTSSSRFASTTAQFTGAGTFLKTGPALTFLANSATTQTFNMSAGGQIDIQGGTLSHFSTQAGNLASLNINGGAAGNISNLNAINTVFFDALTGGGSLNMTGAGTRTVTLGVNNTAAGTYNGAGTATFSGVIGNTGTINLVKTGTGTQIFSGVNTYTGSTTVSGGTLLLSRGGSTANDYMASSGYSIATGATLQVDQTSDSARMQNNNGVISGAGTFLKTGGGLTHLANNPGSQMVINMSAGGLVDVQGGTLSATRTASTNLASLNLAGGALYTINSSGANPGDAFFDSLTGAGQIQIDFGGTTRTLHLGTNNTSIAGANFSGVIADGSAVLHLEKSGSGTQTLSGANTYSGDTTVNGTGTLELAGPGSLQNANVLVNSGRFLQSGGVNNVNGAGPVNMNIASGAVYQLDGGDLDFHDTDLGNPSTLNIAAGGTFDFNGGRLLDVSTIETNGGVFQQGDSLANGGRFVVGRDLAAGQIMAEVSTINGGYTQLGGVLALDIFGQLENEIDMLVVNGDVTMNGSIDANVNGVDTMPFQWYNAVKTGDGFDIALGGTFNVNGFNFRVIDDPNGMGRILQIAVPEPASVLLWGLLVAGLGLYTRRRRLKR